MSRFSAHEQYAERAQLDGPMFQRVLCGVRDERRSQEAARQAVALAMGGGMVDFVAISGRPEPGVAGIPLSPERAELALADARAAAAQADVRVTTRRIDDPSPARRLLELSAEHDLLVVGGHRHRSRVEAMVLGETAGVVLHRAAIPVLVARAYDTGAGTPAHVLAATSARRDDRDTVRIAAELAHRHGARLTVLHVSDRASWEERRELEGQAVAARALGGQDAVLLVEPGRPVQGILEIAHSHADTLIVIGARGEAGLAALGSVSERVGARARCSVLVLRHP
jgi:nucleotide-binding universal stress UspA family protein